MVKTARALGLLVLTFVLSACEFEEIDSAYRAECAEAATVPFDRLKPDSTCNGMPVLFAIAKRDYIHGTDRFLDKYGKDLNYDAIDPMTGMNPAMTAAQSGNEEGAIVLYKRTVNKDLRDNQGRHFIHILVTQEVRPSSYMFAQFDDVFDSSALQATDAQGRVATQLAYEMGRYDNVWALIREGGNLDFLGDDPLAIDVEFLFGRGIDSVPEILDSNPNIARARYTGSIVIESAYGDEEGTVYSFHNRSLAEFAGDTCKKNLADHLRRSGIMGSDAVLFNCEYSLSGFLFQDNSILFGTYTTQSIFTSLWNLKEPEYYTEGQNYAHLILGVLKNEELDTLFLPYKQDGFDFFVWWAKPYFDDRDSFGFLPVHYWLRSKHRLDISSAQYKSDPDRLKSLIQATPNSTKLTRNQDSILTFAVMTGRLELVKTVLKAGEEFKALKNVRNAQNLLPADFALSLGYQDIYEYLAKTK